LEDGSGVFLELSPMRNPYLVTYSTYNTKTGENKPFIIRRIFDHNPRLAITKALPALRWAEWKFRKTDNPEKLALAEHPDGKIITAKIEEGG
jgi:hypothetical protein